MIRLAAVTHLRDAQTDANVTGITRRTTRALGARSVLFVPLLHHDSAIGVIVVSRGEVRPFSEKEIELIKTFAAQAVIAIENARLFQELDARNRELTEALEQQTATSEVLKVISRSTFDLQPVLETLIESVVRLCGADSGLVYRQDGNLYRVVVAWGTTPAFTELAKKYPMGLNRESATGRAILTAGWYTSPMPSQTPSTSGPVSKRQRNRTRRSWPSPCYERPWSSVSSRSSGTRYGPLLTSRSSW